MFARFFDCLLLCFKGLPDRLRFDVVMLDFFFKRLLLYFRPVFSLKLVDRASCIRCFRVVFFRFCLGGSPNKDCRSPAGEDASKVSEPVLQGIFFFGEARSAVLLSLKSRAPAPRASRRGIMFSYRESIDAVERAWVSDFLARGFFFVVFFETGRLAAE